MLVNDIGSLDHGVARGDGAVGLNLEDKAVVVGVLTDTASLNELGATGNRRVQRVDVDHTDGIVVALVGLARNIAAAIADAHLMVRWPPSVSVAMCCSGLTSSNSDGIKKSGPVTSQGPSTEMVAVASSVVPRALKTRPLTFQDDVGEHSPDHVRDGHELVLRTIDLNSLTVAPSSEDRSTRRRELPSVSP